MGFSKDVREDALVRSARYCCICHKYKGLKIEVHHIVPEARSHDNSLENAIALCMDCHTDVGHYNNEHPKGSKFTPQELKKQREAWYQIVRENKIQSPNEYNEFLHFRYIVLQDFQVARKVFNGDNTLLPVKIPLVVKNSIYHYISSLLPQNMQEYQRSSILINEYFNSIDLEASRPDLIKSQDYDSDFPYYTGYINPTDDDIAKVNNVDKITSYILSSGTAPNIYSRIYVIINDECAGDYDNVYKEYISFKDIWFVFLSITNSSEKNIKLLTWDEECFQGVNAHSEISISETMSRKTKVFPSTPIMPGESVVMPLSIIMPPFEKYWDDEIEINTVFNTDTNTTSAYIHHTDFKCDKEFYFVGEGIKIDKVKFAIDDTVLEEKPHSFDPSNLYSITSFWQCGSCPHIFWINDSKNILYYGEVIRAGLNNVVSETIIIPSQVKQMILAELEEEETHIEKIYVNKNVYVEGVRLIKGEYLVLEVSENDTVEIVGHYTLKNQYPQIPDEKKYTYKNSSISRFMKQYTSNHFERSFREQAAHHS